MGKSHSGDEQKRSAAGDRGREGFGDEGGSRVGRPDPAQGATRDEDGFSRGPSSQPVKEGLEGAVLDDAGDAGDDRKARARTGSTGAGNEAARGIHEAQSDGAPATDAGSGEAMDRPGSEPLEGRKSEHESGYGGKMGEPRKGA